MNELDKQYLALLQDILDNGIKKNTRNGEVLSVFGRSIRYKFKDGKFPLLTTKKMAWKTMVTELLWFLRGDTNIKFLVDNDCHIWNGDAYKNYSNKVQPWEPHLDEKMFVDRIKTDNEFAKQWGELGKIYGHGWRNWNGKSDDEFGNKGIDQIQNLINDLKTNPDSRRLLLSAWNASDLPHQVLPPCHYGFQVYTRELSIKERFDLASKTYKVFDPFDFNKCTHEEINELYPVPKRAISLMFNMRSTDVGLGLSFNLSSYGLLLMIIAKQVNMVPDELIYNGGDVHLYRNHIEPIKEQLTRKPYELPTVKLSDRDVNDISEYTLDDITLENYQSHPTIKMPLSN